MCVDLLLYIDGLFPVREGEIMGMVEVLLWIHGKGIKHVIIDSC